VDYNRKLVEKISKVAVADVETVASVYFRPFLEFQSSASTLKNGCSLCVVTNTDKVKAVVDSFQALQLFGIPTPILPRNATDTFAWLATGDSKAILPGGFDAFKRKRGDDSTSSENDGDSSE